MSVVMQIKTAMRCQYTPIKKGQNQALRQLQMLARTWTNQNTCALQAGMQIGAATLEESLAVSYKARLTFYRMFSTHSPLVSTQRSGKHVYTKTTWMFLAALFIIAQS